MAIQTLNNGDLALTQRTKINENFSELKSDIEDINSDLNDKAGDIRDINNILSDMQNGDKYIQKTTIKKITTGEDIPSTLEDGELYFQLF